MAEALSTFLATKRYAVVTGSNKGIGFEICRQLASNGVIVVFTSRDEKKGLEAVKKLKDDFGLSDFAFFHQLDVSDQSSIASLADFLGENFGKLDILINNAGVGGCILDPENMAKAVEREKRFPQEGEVWDDISTENYALAEECLNTNYYGTKTMIEAMLPLLQLSDSPRIVNVSSLLGLLELIPGERQRQILSDTKNLTEEKIDKLLEELLRDFKEDQLEGKGWPSHLRAYKVTKASVNAYTRMLAKKFPSFLINSVCPGFVRTDITRNTGFLDALQGAESPVWLALLPKDGPSGLFFSRKDVTHF